MRPGLNGSDIWSSTMGDSRAAASIGMPMYDAERYSRQALDSLLAQDYGDLRVAILDNASTGRTGEIHHEYAVRDDRIRHHRNKVGLAMKASSAQTSPTDAGRG